MKGKLEFLQSIPYFAGLEAAEVEAIEPLVFEKSFSRNQVILLEGEPGDSFYIIASGRVKVFKTSPEGKEQIIRIMGKGESFNEVPLFDGGPNPVSVAALEPTLLYGIRRSDMALVLQQHPLIAANVIKVLAGRLRHLVSLVEDLSFRHVTSRLAKVLLDYAREEGSRKPRLTQQEMAAMVGTAREIISRALRTLEEKGIIRRERHRIIITDVKALREISGAYSSES